MARRIVTPIAVAFIAITFINSAGGSIDVIAESTCFLGASESAVDEERVMARPLWFERKFDFSFPVELYPEIIERLRGTPARVEERVRDVPPALLTRRDGDKWSIQENIGHLLDLDELFAGRFEDYERGLEKLRAADLLNQKTHEAQHNSRSAEEILREFRRGRLALVARLESQPPEYFRQTALHPRLNTPMRVTDLLYFVAEHDDHHLARISELLRAK